MRTPLAAVLAMVLAIGCTDQIAPTAPEAPGPNLAVITNDFVPLQLNVFISCANDGSGEVAEMSGRLHVLETQTTNAAGGSSSTLHFQPMNVKGFGDVTGDRYNANGLTRFSTTIGPGGLPFSDTFVNNFYIIGQGPGNNFQVHSTMHITINANGVVTANVDNGWAVCA